MQVTKKRLVLVVEPWKMNGWAMIAKALFLQAATFTAAKLARKVERVVAIPNVQKHS